MSGTLKQNLLARETEEEGVKNFDEGRYSFRRRKRKISSSRENFI